MRGEIKELLFIKVIVYLPLKLKSIKVEFWSLSAEVREKSVVGFRSFLHFL